MNFVSNGIAKGPSVEVVQQIQKKLGVKGKIKILPWKRGYNTLETTKNTALFSTTRTEKREHQFKWVGPLAFKNYGFYAKKSSQLNIKSLEDAKKYKVGGQAGGVSEDFLKRNGFNKVQLVTRPAQNFQKLAASRIDLWYTSATTPIGLEKKSDINRKDFEMVFIAKQSSLYLAFNKGTSDDVIDAWQKAYDELYDSGEMKAIFHGYGFEDLFPAK